MKRIIILKMLLILSFGILFLPIGNASTNTNEAKIEEQHREEKRLEEERLERKRRDQKIEDQRLEQRRLEEQRLQRKLDDERWRRRREGRELV